MKIGIIGLGRRMSNLLNNVLYSVAPEAEIVGLIDPDPEAKSKLRPEDQARVKLFNSVDDLVCGAKPDALFLATQCDTHTPLAIQIAKYDIPLFLEKPVAINMEQAVALEKGFEKSRCPVLVSFPLRVSRLCERVKQLIVQGTVGRVEHVTATNYVSYGNVYFDTWHRNYPVTQGLFLQKATHDFDYLIHLVGAPIVRVAAMSSLGRVYRDKKTLVGAPDPYSNYLEQIGTPEEGMNEDSSSALIEFANGAKGVYTQIFFSKRHDRRGAIISGHRGMIDFDWYKDRIDCVHHQQPFNDSFIVNEANGHFGGDLILLQNFLAMVRDRKVASLAPIQTGLESVYACLAAKESAETGRFLNVRQVGQC